MSRGSSEHSPQSKSDRKRPRCEFSTTTTREPDARRAFSEQEADSSRAARRECSSAARAAAARASSACKVSLSLSLSLSFAPPFFNASFARQRRLRATLSRSVTRPVPSRARPARRLARRRAPPVGLAAPQPLPAPPPPENTDALLSQVPSVRVSRHPKNDPFIPVADDRSSSPRARARTSPYASSSSSSLLSSSRKGETHADLWV